ncbi:MAG: flagellar biosynthetic protein FliR [Pseudomonadota bacterium]
MTGGEEDVLIGLLALLTGVVSTHMLAAAGLFARIVAALFYLPGIGERAVPMRIRLGLALLLAWLLAPLLAGLADGLTLSPVTLILVLIAEAAAGLVIGLAFRFLIWALQIAGTIASQSITISHIFGNAIAGEAEPSLASLLAMAGIALALLMGLHIDAVGAIAGLYGALPFGLGIAGGEAAEWSTARAGEAFALGLGLAVPFVLAGFAYNLTLGALSRAMPQLLVALVGVPLLVGLGLGTLWYALPELFARWLSVAAAIAADPLATGIGQ